MGTAEIGDEGASFGKRDRTAAAGTEDKNVHNASEILAVASLAQG